MFKLGRLLGAVLFALVMGIIPLVLPVKVMAQSTVTLLSSFTSLDRGAKGTISVTITGDNIGAFELNVTCKQPGILHFDKVASGNLPEGFSVIANVRDPNTIGVSGFMSSKSISDSVIVADIAFTATGKPGKAVTVIVDGNIYDPDGNAIQGIEFSSASLQITGKDNLNILQVIAGVGGTLLLGVFSFITLKLNSARKRKRNHPPDEIIELTWNK